MSTQSKLSQKRQLLHQINALPIEEFVASAELTEVSEVPLKKRLCLSAASLSFLGMERVKGRNPTAVGIEAVHESFFVSFFAVTQR